MYLSLPKLISYLIPVCTFMGLGVQSVHAKITSMNKSISYCSEGSPTGFDPSNARSITDYTASSATIYNRLLEFKQDDIKKAEPSLAERWEISENGLVYTFHLRRGVKFHTTSWFKPSREFNAEDVVFTFERMRNPDMPFRKAYPVEFIDFHRAGLDKLIAKIEAIKNRNDKYPYTVKFTLNKAHAPFLSNLAMPFSSILSAEYAAQLLKADTPSDISWKPVGTGPFIFQKYIKDASIVFKGNSAYWKPKDVQLSKLNFLITPNAQVRVQKLKMNECQVISSLNLTDTGTLESASKLRVLHQTGFNITYLAYNTTHKPLDDVRVRRALDMAIDKKAIIDQVYAGHAQLAVAPMSPLQWSYDETLQDTARDFKQAKALLAQAGYPKGFKISLWAIPTTSRLLMAEMIQQDWRKIGVEAEIVSYELGEFIKRATHGEHDTLVISWVGYSSDPDSWLRNISFLIWKNESFNELIQNATQTTDTQKRTQLYVQAQRIFKYEQPLTPIAYVTDYQAISKNVTGFKINPLGLTIFSGVGLK